MDNKSGSFTSRDLALVAGMSALYLGYSYVSGVTLGHTIREIFDLTLRAGDHIFDNLSRKRFVVAGALGNLAMAVFGLAMLQAFGFFQGFGVSALIVIWVTALVGDTLVGALGALFGTAVVRRLGERVRSPLIR